MKTEKIIDDVNKYFYNTRMILPVTGDIIKEMLIRFYYIDVNFSCNILEFNKLYLNEKYNTGNVINAIQYLSGYVEVIDIFFKDLEKDVIVPNYEVRDILDYESKVCMYMRLSEKYKQDNLL